MPDIVCDDKPDSSSSNVRPHVEEIHPTRKICVLALISLPPAKVFGMLLTILHR
jgi:hypothetical protein